MGAETLLPSLVRRHDNRFWDCLLLYLLDLRTGCLALMITYRMYTYICVHRYMFSVAGCFEELLFSDPTLVVYPTVGPYA